MHYPTNDVKLDFDDVLIVPKTSSLDSRKSVNLNREFVTHTGCSWSGIPIIASNMDTIGTPKMANALAKHSMPTAMDKYTDYSELNELINNWGDHIFFTMGITEADMQRLDNIIAFMDGADSVFLYPPSICIDVANGYTVQFLEAVRKVRNKCPNAFIMAGNVVTPEKTEQVLLAGADCVKVGIGPGSVCTTRLKTGVGYPQLSAIMECADAAHGLNGLVCGDGGCKTPGDVVKAFGAGADFVMIGGMLAGTDESAGEVIYKEPPVPTKTTGETMDVYLRPVADKVRFYGMSSRTANEKYHGELADYKTAEGKEVYVDYVGTADDVVQDILGGLRSAMTYVGASKLKELTKRTKFIRVNNTHNRVFG
jgi:GMP reductase